MHSSSLRLQPLQHPPILQYNLTVERQLPLLNSNRSRSLVRGGAAGIDRPDLAPGSQFEEITQGQSRGCASVAAGTPLATPARWYDPCAFTVPAAGFLGTAGRNTGTATTARQVQLALKILF